MPGTSATMSVPRCLPTDSCRPFHQGTVSETCYVYKGVVDDWHSGTPGDSDGCRPARNGITGRLFLGGSRLRHLWFGDDRRPDRQPQDPGAETALRRRAEESAVCR